MPRDKPPPRTLEPEEERKVQLFLERAAPIVLENRTLDAANYRALQELAHHLELSDEQLQLTIDDLRQRGVIDKVDMRPAKPPPLPLREGTDDEEDDDEPVNADSSEDGLPQELIGEEESFSLTPPPPPPRPSKPVRPTLGAQASAPTETFARRVEAIVAEQRGLGADARIRIAAAAQEMGVSDEEVQTTLNKLGRASGEPSAVNVATGGQLPVENDPYDGSERNRWRIEGQPPPQPAPSRKKPHETFRDFVEKSFEKFADGHVSADLEDGIIKHGTKVLRLAPVFARHIVVEVAGDRGLALETQAKTPSVEPDQETPTLVRQFRQRAGPILVQHRGINAQSRVLLTALAEEMGLPSEQVESAIFALEAATAETPSPEQERADAFKAYARESLDKLPRGILLPGAHELLVERASERYGIEPVSAESILRQLADEHQISVITREDAAGHIEALADEMMGDASQLTFEQRERIFGEASQWGLTADEVAKLLAQLVNRRYRQRKSEQKLANAALVAAALAVALLLGLMAWVVASSLAPAPTTTLAPVAEPVVDRPPPLEPNLDDSWWNASLSVAVSATRLEFPLLRHTVNDVASKDPERRAAAYENLISHLFERVETDQQRLLFLELLARSFALEPSDESADRLATALLDSVPGPEDRLGEDEHNYVNFFWALRIAVAAVSHGNPDDQRAVRLVSDIGRVVGATLDAAMPRVELERKSLGALAERLYRMLIASIETRPELTEKLHSTVAAQAELYLNRSLVDKLNAEFLVALLGKDSGRWSDFEALLADTARSPNPLAVVRLVEIFESSTERDLQLFLAPILSGRVGVVLDRDSTVSEIADTIRQALGLDGSPNSRWVQYAALLSRQKVMPPAPPDDHVALLQETIAYARLATLGCAAAQRDTGATAFDKWLDRDVPDLAMYAEEAKSASTDSSIAPRRYIDRALVVLRRRSSPENRVHQVSNLADAAATSSILSPGEASQLALYLLRNKVPNEFDAITKYFSNLGKWKHLRLAIADRLENAEISPRKQRILIEQLVQDRLPSGSEIGKKKEDWRIALLASVEREAVTQLVNPSISAVLQPTRDTLLLAYQAQVAVMAAGRPSPDDPSSPSTFLKVMLGHFAERLATADLAETDRRFVDDLPYQLEAIEFVQADDLQRTLLLERAWMRVLAAYATGQDAGVAGQTQAVLERLRDRDRTANSRFVQLRDGQRALAELWQVLGKEGGL
jgi:hypothetical protein